MNTQPNATYPKGADPNTPHNNAHNPPRATAWAAPEQPDVLASPLGATSRTANRTTPVPPTPLRRQPGMKEAADLIPLALGLSAALAVALWATHAPPALLTLLYRPRHRA